MDGHPVVLGARLEAVAQRELEIALAPGVGPAALVDVAADEQLAREGEQVGVRAALVAPPAVEVRAGHHVGGDALVEEGEQRLVVGEDVAPARAPLERLDLLEQPAVVGEEEMARLPVALDERAADEQLARQGGVDRPVGDRAGGDRQPVQRDALGRDDRRALGLPARLAVRALDEVLGERLDPLRLDARGDAAPQPRRLDQLGDHHPGRRLGRQRRGGEDREARVASALVLAAARILEADVRQQAGQERGVDVVWLGRRPVAADADLFGRLAQLSDEVLPLAHAQVVQELGVAALAELVARQAALLGLQVAPEVEIGEEVRTRVGEARVLLVGRLAALRRALARVLDRQPGGDDDHLVGAAEPVGLEDHPAQPRVDRQPGEAAPELGQPLLAVQRAELLQQQDAVAHLQPVGRVHEREVLDPAEAQRRHLQDHRGEARAEDLGVGEARALREVVLAVEADADAVRRASAAALALVGGGLRDGLDRQPLHLQPRAVAADAGGPGVDDVPDAGHGQRGLGDVAGVHAL